MKIFCIIRTYIVGRAALWFIFHAMWMTNPWNVWVGWLTQTPALKICLLWNSECDAQMKLWIIGTEWEPAFRTQKHSLWLIVLSENKVHFCSWDNSFWMLQGWLWRLSWAPLCLEGALLLSHEVALSQPPGQRRAGRKALFWPFSIFYILFCLIMHKMTFCCCHFFLFFPLWCWKKKKKPWNYRTKKNNNNNDNFFCFSPSSIMIYPITYLNMLL